MNKLNIAMILSLSLVVTSWTSLNTITKGHCADTTSNKDCRLAKKIIYKDLPNFYQVSDNLYRGAQPINNGMWQLKKIGVKSVLNLRSLHSDRKLLKGTALNSYRLRMKAWHAEEEDVVAFLKIVKEKKNTPLFVHCQHGSDRTGTLVAFYRIVFCGWSKEKAIYEMTRGGFGYHTIWRNLPAFIRQSDIKKIKRKAGIK